MSIDFHRLIEAIDNNRLIIIDYIDYIDCLPMIDFHRLGTPGFYGHTMFIGGNNRKERDIFLQFIAVASGGVQNS